MPGRGVTAAPISSGRVLLVGQDWDTFVVDAGDRALTRTIVHARADTTASPWAARRYRVLLRDAGFDEITVQAHTAVFTDPVMLPVLLGLAAAAHAARGSLNLRRIPRRPSSVIVTHMASCRPSMLTAPNRASTPTPR